MNIKKLAAVALICFLLPLMAFGFDLAIGVKGGVGAPHLSGPDYEDLLDFFGIKTQFKLGYSGGVFVTVGLFDLLAIQPEAHYAMLGGRFGDDTGWFWQDSPVIEIPVLVKVRLRAGSLAFVPYAGPSVLIKMGEWTNELQDADGNVVASGTYTDEQVADFIFGIVAGAGVEFSMGGGILSLEARYLLGLTSRFDPDVFADSDVRQNNFQILVGFGFPVIK